MNVDGGLGDPFGDADLNGYSNLQEMLGGSDPNNGSSVPVGPVVNFALPVIAAALNSGQVTVTFDWPSGYFTSFRFGVNASAALGSGFIDLVVPPPVSLGGNRFSITFTPPALSEQFFVLTVGLQL